MNARTFLAFLKHLVSWSRRKLFLILDNGPCHSLDQDGKAWLGAQRQRIELFRLPPCSPEFNPIEGLGGLEGDGPPAAGPGAVSKRVTSPAVGQQRQVAAAQTKLTGCSGSKTKGGAMDIAVGAKNVLVVTDHVTKDGAPAVVSQCPYPLTARGVVDLIVDRAVL